MFNRCAVEALTLIALAIVRFELQMSETLVEKDMLRGPHLTLLVGRDMGCGFLMQC